MLSDFVLKNKIFKLVVRFSIEPAKSRNVYKKTAFILILSLIFSVANAQYIQFAQFYAAPLVLAPSFTGATDGARVTLNYRDQWTGLQRGVFITSAAAFDINAPKVKSGFGFLVVRDQAGEGNLGRIDVGLLYSWYTQISGSGIYFRPGLQLKLSQRGVDITKLVFPDQLEFDVDQYQPTINPDPAFSRLYFFDATASVLFYSDAFWIGLTADHLFRPHDAFYDPNYRVPIKYQSFGGYKFGNKYTRYGTKASGDSYMVSYNFRYQGGSVQLDVGGYWNHEPLLVGIWFRGLPYLNITHTVNMDAMVFMVGYKIFNFSIGYSYDLTVSPLLMSAGGSHEISISYNFKTNTRSRQRKGAIPCPSL